MNDKYSGWTNRETWAAHLCLTNSESAMRSVRDLIDGLTRLAPFETSGVLTTDQFVRSRLAKSLNDQYETAWAVLIDSPSEVPRDLRMELQDIGSLWRVDWDEIVRALLDK